MCPLPPLLEIREVNKRDTHIGNKEIKESTNVFLKIYFIYYMHVLRI